MTQSKRKITKNRRNLIICISGMAGSGKSTLAKRLAEKYRLRYFSGGDALKALAMEEGYKSVDYGWWESEEGTRFLERRGKDQTFDQDIDRKLVELAKIGNVIMDSWTMPWLLQKGFKIWLEASPDVRAKRIAGRDQTSLQEASKALKRKEKHTQSIYKKLYGFDLGEDYSPFHLILDTNTLEAEEVFQTLCAMLDNCSLIK